MNEEQKRLALELIERARQDMQVIKLAPDATTAEKLARAKVLQATLGDIKDIVYAEIVRLD